MIHAAQPAFGPDAVLLFLRASVDLGGHGLQAGPRGRIEDLLQGLLAAVALGQEQAQHVQGGLQRQQTEPSQGGPALSALLSTFRPSNFKSRKTCSMYQRARYHATSLWASSRVSTRCVVSSRQ